MAMIYTALSSNIYFALYRNSSESQKEISAVDCCFSDGCFSQNAIHNNKSSFRSMLLDIKFDRKDQLDDDLLFIRAV